MRLDEFALVLNAGSSSLKFCVFAHAPETAWRLAARGQLDGIGSTPRFTAKGAGGEVLANHPLDAKLHDARGALDHLAGWLRSAFGGARVVGVGHRVVHGGLRTAPVLL